MAGLRTGSSTPWTDILAAKNNPALRRECLEMFAEKYRKPISEYIRRCFDLRRPEEVEDLTQAYFCRFLQKSDFDTLDPARGRLRYWLATSVRRFVIDEFRKSGNNNPESLVFRHAPLPEGDIVIQGRDVLTPEEEFNRQWAIEIYADAVEAFRRYCGDKGKQHYFSVFERHVVDHADQPSYEQTAEALGISVKDVANYLNRSKKKFQTILREQIRGTVASDEEVEQEIDDLIRYFQS